MEDKLSEIDVHCLHLWRSMIQNAINEQDKVLAQCLRLASDEVAPTLLGDMIHHSLEESFRGEHSLLAWLGIINETLTTQDIRMARTLRIMSDEIYPSLIEPIPPTHLVSASDLSSLISPPSISAPAALAKLNRDASVPEAEAAASALPTPESKPESTPEPDPTADLRLDDVDAVAEHLRVFQISEEEMEISRRVLNGEIDISAGMDLVMQMFSTRVPRYSSEGGLIVDIKPPQ
jgi:hypothetical protein